MDDGAVCARCLKWTEQGHWCQPEPRKTEEYDEETGEYVYKEFQKIYCCDACRTTTNCIVCSSVVCARCHLQCDECQQALCVNCADQQGPQRFRYYVCGDGRHADRCSQCQAPLNGTKPCRMKVLCRLCDQPTCGTCSDSGHCHKQCFAVARELFASK